MAPMAVPSDSLHARWPSGVRTVVPPSWVKIGAGVTGLAIAAQLILLAVPIVSSGAWLVGGGIAGVAAWKVLSWIMPMGQAYRVPSEDLPERAWITQQENGPWPTKAVMKVFADHRRSVPRYHLALSDGNALMCTADDTLTLVEIADPYARQRLTAPAGSPDTPDLRGVYAVLDAIWTLEPPPNEHRVSDVLESDVLAQSIEHALVDEAIRMLLVRRIGRKRGGSILAMTDAGRIWYAQASREMGVEVLEGAAPTESGPQVIHEEKTVVIGPGAIISAPITIADGIESSFNNIRAAPALDDSVKSLLTELGRAVLEVSRTAPELAPDLSADFQALTRELAREQPRTRWYQAALGSLKDAAATVGSVGNPVADLATKLAQLL